MALSVVQQGDSGGTAIASGAGGIVLPSNSTVAGTAHVAVLAIVGADALGHVTGVSSGIGSTWTRGASVVVAGVAEMEIWTATVTGASRSASVTNSTGAAWYGQCTEVGGGVASVGQGGTASGLTANPSLTVTGLAAGDMALVLSAVFTTMTGGPSSPWVDYDAGGFTIAGGQDVAYNIISSGTSATASWTAIAQAWAAVGAILVPTASTNSGGAFFVLV